MDTSKYVGTLDFFGILLPGTAWLIVSVLYLTDLHVSIELVRGWLIDIEKFQYVLALVFLLAAYMAGFIANQVGISVSYAIERVSRALFRRAPAGAGASRGDACATHPKRGRLTRLQELFSVERRYQRAIRLADDQMCWRSGRREILEAHEALFAKRTRANYRYLKLWMRHNAPHLWQIARSMEAKTRLANGVIFPSAAILPLLFIHGRDAEALGVLAFALLVGLGNFENYNRETESYLQGLHVIRASPPAGGHVCDADDL